MTAPTPSFTTAQLAEHVGGEVRGRADLLITAANSLADAGPSEITFIANADRGRQWPRSKAGAALVSPRIAAEMPAIPDRTLILVPHPELALITVLELWQVPDETLAEGVHPTAIIDPQATLGPGTRVGPYATIAAGVRTGSDVRIHAGVRIYRNVTIGDRTVIHANTVIRMNCTIGNDVILNQNVSIGADGFGYRPAADGSRLLKMPHVGTVIIEDDVEIGSNSCVDRGKFGATVVGRSTKLDNLVQVAHNVRIGPCCVVASSTAIGGSTIIGRGVRIGGCVGVSDNVTIGDGASIGAKAGVTKNVPPGQTWHGFPAEPAGEKLRQWAALRKLPAILGQLSPGRGMGRPGGGSPGGTAPDSTHASGR